MKTKIDFSLSIPRIFTYEELVKISDENFEVLNRNIDPMTVDKKGTFVLTPIMLHHHAFGEPVAPHLRTYVTNQADKEFCGFQDLTFDQFRAGKRAA
jgi:hypothetical protein